ncbi:MAG: methyltransferase domain-containing protein [Dysgonamonadaceae bacterium]|jgi:SAM-dependent methyltransferase|nr:methyltransferase domain-containing protein [Dysgonamonadaceae bacterium]
MYKRFHKYYLRQRFFPDLLSIVINPFYFCRKLLLKQVRLSAPELSGKLLDFGCGSKPYRSLFTQVDEYIGMDIENKSHDHKNEDIDVFYDGNNIPFEDNTFDSILASEVLEHVPNIDKTLSEWRRVLKPNGKLIATVPFVWQEHEMPYDFRRFTSNGIEQLLTEYGFNIIQNRKVGSFFEVLVQMTMMYLHSIFYTKNKYILNLFINAIFVFPVCLIGILLVAVFPKKQILYFDTIITAKNNGKDMK